MNHKTTQNIILKMMFILAFFTGIISVKAQGISMSPTRLFFSGNPGETLTENVIFTNGSANSITFNTRINDWYRDSIGEKLYMDPNTLSKSNSSWISIPEELFTVDAGSTLTIPVTMHIPENIPVSDVTNSMLFFTQIGRQDDNYQSGMGIGLQVLFEFGLHVYNTPPTNQTQDLEFTAVDDLGIINKGDNPYRRVGIKIKNVGNTISDSSVELELTNKNSGEEIKLTPVNISMLPEAEQLVYFDIPAETKGSYAGVSFIKMGGTTDIRVAEKDFEFN
ncbi:hypothetical protein [Albibacterium sp.]|uniref:hypothetical protein n=1 Tax=Albibacterium sp. TaxID=2952885 RepID=UPI002B8AB0DE|nr:hypothetical protein [Albibacterium sp.]HUH18723.1 hypothetical protein [Albibacterium sp.]